MKAESTKKGKDRWYKHAVCGEDHPSMTTLLGVISSHALMNWMAKNGTAKLDIYHDSAAGLLPEETIKAIDQIAEKRWLLANKTAFWKSGKQLGEEAADYGTMAHGWIEAFLHGKHVDLEALPLPAQNAVQGFLKWFKEHHVEVLSTEQTFYNCKLHYAGTADCVAKVDGELTLIDWKTSSGIWMEYPIQAWGYALADESTNHDRLYRQVAIGRFGKDGDSEVRIFKRNFYPSIEIARDIITACGHIFSAIQEWDRQFPYKRKEKIIEQKQG